MTHELIEFSIRDEDVCPSRYSSNSSAAKKAWPEKPTIGTDHIARESQELMFSDVKIESK